jgi:hypothetical protein
MNGLEAILFAVFIVFVLINLLIRFFVRKAKRQKMEGTTQPRETPDEEIVQENGQPWILLQGLKEAAPEVEPSVQGKPIEPRVQFTAEQISGTQVVQRPEEISRLEREIESRPESWEKDRIEKLEGTIEVKTVVEEKEVSFWERIGKLTPLQRAIVLSEVLGPPKGLQ